MFYNLLGYFQNSTIRQWTMPFCAFFTTFTVVMTLLIVSTDFKNRHYIPFNSTILWEFEEWPQESVELIHIIQQNYIKPPLKVRKGSGMPFRYKPTPVLLSLFKPRRKGIFFECGAGLISDTKWLERAWDWDGLLTQPHPLEYEKLVSDDRRKAHTAQVCISPIVYPKHAFFENSSSASNETLTAIPCFPLYSLMRAFNVTTLDLLILNDVRAHIQILKTLPIPKVRIGIIGFVLKETGDDADEADDPCCSELISDLLSKWGYKRVTDCPTSSEMCYFKCKSRTYCPIPQRK